MKATFPWWAQWISIFAIIFIAGCANNTGTKGPFDAQNPHWQGRLAVRVESTPVQAFSADFDLQGSAQAGSMAFTSPLGSTLARLQWDADAATLQTTGEAQHFASLDALVWQATGTNLPIANLFLWLQGIESDTPGWQADLQDLPTGRLSARRLPPGTPAELKIILDR